MPLPWLAVGQLVLGNLDKIIAVVRPGFTRKQGDAATARADLIDQQIAELQSAAANNAEQIAALATQLKEVVAALEQAALEAAAQRTAARRLALAAGVIALIALAVAAAAIATH
jgi:predicted HAD superfamily Cof-like phosphohydrolase